MSFQVCGVGVVACECGGTADAPRGQTGRLSAEEARPHQRQEDQG